MGLIFLDSVDHYAAADRSKKWVATSSDLVGVGTGIRGSAIGATLPGETLRIHTGGANKIAVGFRVLLGGSTGGMDLVQLSTAAGLNTVLIHSMGALRLFANSIYGTALTNPSSKVLTTYNWYYLELLQYTANSGGYITVRVNGETWFDLQGIDSQFVATDLIDNIILVTGPGGTWFDEIYVATGDDAKFYGDNRIDSLLPSGSGTYSQWTGSDTDQVDNYALVDEATLNSDTDYVACSTAGQIETYQYPDLAYSAGSVAGIQQVVTACKVDAGSRTLRFICRIGGTDYPGGTVALTDSYLCHRYIWETNPVTGTAWTPAEVNAAEFGFKLES